MAKVVLISEQQKRILLREEISDRISSTIESNYNFVKKVVETTSKQTGLDVRFLITWGAAIGGMMRPLSDFITGIEPSLTEDELCLILTSLMFNYYFDSKTFLNKLKSQISKHGLTEIYKKANDKADELKQTFSEFIKSLNITVHRMTNIMAYTFVIPIIPMLVNFAHGDITKEDTVILVKRIIAFGLVALTGNIIKELITKMINRFKSY